MKIKNSIFELPQYTETIAKVHSSEKLSVMEAYRINRMVKKLNELNVEYSELKQVVLDKLGKPGEEEGMFIIEPDNRPEFMEEMNVLLNIEHDLEMEQLAWPKKLKDGFSAADIGVIDLFFNLEEFNPKEEKE